MVIKIIEGDLARGWGREVGTHNRLAKSSMELITALERATVAQMLEKEVFLHSALGIRAGLPRLTWKWTQVMKVGRAMAATQRMMMLSAERMREGFALRILCL